MSDESTLRDLLANLRGDDEKAADWAAADLYAEYAPYINRMIRTRLRNLSLQRVVGEEDICQSVMKSFFLRYRVGQFDLTEPDNLRRLLARMAENKLNDQHKKNLAIKRGHGGAGELPADNVIPSAGETPSVKLGNRELLELALGRMTPEEREIRELVLAGEMNWADIAAKLGGTAEARRKQWERVCDRVVEELGL